MAVPHVTKIRTEAGDAKIDYNALANLPTIDKDLKQSGGLADAKAVGDAFNAVNQNLSGFEKTLNEFDAQFTENIKAMNEKLDGKLDKSGAEMADNLNMGGFAITNLPDPVNDRDAVNKAFVDSKIKDIVSEVSKKAETDIYLGVFAADNWVGEEAPYTQEIVVNGVLSSDSPLVDINLSDVSDYISVIENWALVGRVTVFKDNTIVGYCYEDKPEVDMPIVLKVVR